jgi:hypothetical protein
MMRILLHIAVWSILMAALPASAQVAVKAALDSADVVVGGKRALRLSFSYTPGIRPLEPGLEALEASKDIELLSATPWDTTSISDRAIHIEKELYLTAWDSGYFFIPSISFPYEIQGRVDTARTREIPLRVHMLPPVAEELMPLKPLIEEPLQFSDFLPWLIGLAILIALAIGIWQYRKRKRRAAPLEAPPVELPPPHLVALEKFRALEEERLWQRGQIKEYHTQLTYILREYLENQFHILALESSTQEIAEQLENKIPEDLRQDLHLLLNTSDLVKFAKAEPAEEVHPRLLSQARHFIQANHP